MTTNKEPISVYFQPDELLHLKEVAKLIGITKNKLIRSIVVGWLAEATLEPAGRADA